MYVSFSGGKDSTVLLDLVRRVFPDTVALFIDTGLEYPELKSFVNTFDNVTIIRPEKNFRSVLLEEGYPIVSKEVSKRVKEYHNAETKGNLEQCSAYKEFNGLAVKPDGTPSNYNKVKWKFLVDAPFKISNKCCDIMKKDPAHKFEKTTGLKPIIGTLACESLARRKVWLNAGCNSFNPLSPKCRPLSFWTESDILKYLYDFNIPYASVYGDIYVDDNGRYHTTGCDRTGCVFCGFGCHLEKEPNRFQRLKKTHPKLWEYCMKSIEDHGLGMKEVLEYIDIKTE